MTKSNRRRFLQVTGAASLTAAFAHSGYATESRKSFDGMVGITTGGGLGKKRERGELNLATLPKYMRDELGMQLIDVNTRWLDSLDPKFLREARSAADDAGCFFSNLKVNDPVSGDLYSKNRKEREQAFAKCRNLIKAAEILGTRWIRFTVPKAVASDPIAHRELAVYAEERKIQLLVENAGWLREKPDSIAKLVKAIGQNVAACPDTGNWDDPVRDLGLRKSFPNAASCDFKVWEMDDDWNHARYDLKKCFDIGHSAGYRGPWIIELMQDDAKFAASARYVRDLLAGWIKQSSK